MDTIPLVDGIGLWRDDPTPSRLDCSPDKAYSEGFDHANQGKG